MEFAITAETGISQKIPIRLMTPGGRKAPGFFFLKHSAIGQIEKR
jgi:hypothetical protein